MVARLLLLVCLIQDIGAEVVNNAQANDLPGSGRMLGVDTVHDAPPPETPDNRINKDTIITRSVVKQKAVKDKSEPERASETAEQRPDWTYSSFPAEVAAHAAQFKRNMSECLKEVQGAEKKAVRRLSPKTESPVHGDCLIACVLKRNGVINNGKINKDQLLTLVGKFYAKDTKLMKKLEKNISHCIERSAARDECAMAARLNDCTNQLMASNKHKITVNY